MKIFIIALSFLITFATQAQQTLEPKPAHNNYLSLKSIKKKGKHSNTLQIYDHKAQLLFETDAGMTGRYAGEILQLNDPNRIYYYALIDRKNAAIKIFSKSDLSLIGNIEIAPLNTYLIGVNPHTFYHLNQDKTKLSVFTGKKKDQTLVIINLETGEISNQLKTGKNKALVNTFNEGDIAVSREMNGSKKNLNVFDINQGKLIYTKTFGNKPLYAHVFKDHIFYGYKKANKNNPSYKYFVRNLRTKELLDFTFTSSYPLQFLNNESKDTLYFAGTETDKDKTLAVFQFRNGTASRIESPDVSVQPNIILLDEAEQRLVAIGKRNMTSVSLTNAFNPVETSLPFDTVRAFLNQAGTLAYLKEGSGSEVALVDLNTGTLIDRSGTGRKGVKFGQFLASTAIMAVGYNYGYFIFSTKYSDTGSALSQNENKLFTINSKTNDVTAFNAKDLSGRTALATGGGTFLVFQSETNNAPLTVLSGSRINWINGQSFEMIKEVEVEKYTGLHLDEELIFTTTDEKTKVYSMKTGEIVLTLPIGEANYVNKL